jgi:hypothetical protein
MTLEPIKQAAAALAVRDDLLVNWSETQLNYTQSS